MKTLSTMLETVAKTVKAAAPKPQTFQAGTTWVGFVGEVDKEGKGVVNPTRDWPDGDDHAVIFTQRQARALRIRAKANQTFLGWTDVDLEDTGDRGFRVELTDANLQWIWANCHFGGKTQVAFFKAQRDGDRAVARKRKAVVKKSLEARLAAIK